MIIKQSSSMKKYFFRCLPITFSNNISIFYHFHYIFRIITIVFYIRVYIIIHRKKYFCYSIRKMDWLSNITDVISYLVVLIFLSRLFELNNKLNNQILNYSSNFTRATHDAHETDFLLIDAVSFLLRKSNAFIAKHVRTISGI